MSKKLSPVISILLLISGFCSAVTPVNINDFTDTSWVLYGTTKVSASRAGSSMGAGVCYTSFDPDGSVHFEDEEGYILSGSYYVEPKGNLVIDITEQDVQEFFDEYIPEALNFSGIRGLDWSIDVIGASTKTSVVCSTSTNTLTTSLSAKANLYIEYQGESYYFKISFVTKLSGDHPAAGASNWSSKWVVNGNANFSARRVRANRPITLNVTLGDYGSTRLDMNEYEIVDATAALFNSKTQGDFCRIKNKVMFLGSNMDIDSMIQDMYMENAPDNVDWVDVAISQTVLTATIKDGKTISLTGNTKFELNIFFNDDTEEIYGSRGSFKLSAMGVPVP